MSDYEDLKRAKADRPDLPDEINEIQCPVCGYYCLGKGGHGCIDKPGFLRLATGHGATLAECGEMLKEQSDE